MKQLLTNHCGIVIKQHENSKHKVILVDNRLGIIEIIFLSTRIMHGALLGYDLEEKNKSYFISTFEIIDIPLILAQSDLLFVHHVLEICFYFIPIGSLYNNTVFELLMLLYTKSQSMWTPQAKKIFLFKLMTTIGVYDENHLFKSPSIILLLNISIDKIYTQSIDLDCEKDIMNWLSISIFAHPNIDCFKTTSFLKEYKVRSHDKKIF